ncbi:MAG: response regulator [Anaerolineae bacterium]|nr:response regulator [Anaerolineae bacterium]
MKIMYVEDNPANISLMMRVARMGGHTVISFTNGEVVLNSYDKENPDLVFMDVQLEGRLTGLEVVRMLRDRGVKTPIVAVTAYAMLGDKERCIEAGCDTYIPKPLPIAELVELLQRYEIETGAAGSAGAARATAEVPRRDPPM